MSKELENYLIKEINKLIEEINFLVKEINKIKGCYPYPELGENIEKCLTYSRFCLKDPENVINSLNKTLLSFEMRLNLHQKQILLTNKQKELIELLLADTN